MNGKDVFRGMQYLNTRFIDQAEFGEFSPEAFEKGNLQQRKKIPFRKALLLAAVIALVGTLVGCGIVYILKMQDIKLGDRQVTEQWWDEESKTMVTETVSQQVLTFAGLKGTPNYEAAKEWYEFRQAYDPDWKIYHEYKDGGKIDRGPEAYCTYNIYTPEMREKVDEITQKHGLKLRGKLVKAFDTEALYAYLGMDGVLLPDGQGEADDVSAAYYDGGWFHTDMHMTLRDTPDWPYEFLCSLYYSPKECFDTTVCELNDTADWQEWNYTTQAGYPVLVIRSPSMWFSWVFCDRGDATITLRIETIREVYTDEHGYQEAIRYPMTDEQLKQVLDCIDFSIKPQPGEASLLEGPEASKELSQTQNGLTVTVQEVFTDGTETVIRLDITASEDVDLEQYQDESGAGIRFDSTLFTPQEPISSHGGGYSHGSEADNDGKANTISYTLRFHESMDEGIAYAEGSVWNLHLKKLMAREWNRETYQEDTLWEQEGTWSFEITMDNGDWTEIEFVSDPITTNVCYGWDLDGNDVYRDETITSIKLRAFGAEYTSPSALGGLDFANYQKEQYPTIILKDGTEIKLEGSLHLMDPDTDRIPMEEVACLKLIDGTVLYPVP